MKNSVKRFEVNETGRDFVIGDIHGCYDYVDALLEKVNFDKTKDRLFSLGDLCDRGPRSKDVMEYLLEPWFFAIKGNHEDMLVNAYERGDNHMFYGNGGIWFTDIVDPVEQQFFCDIFKNLPIAFEIKTKKRKIGMIHAEFPHNYLDDWDDYINVVKLEDSNIGGAMTNISLWSRGHWRQHYHSPDNAPKIKGIDLVFHGHSIFTSPRTFGNCVYIDTGSFINENDYAITMVELDDYGDRYHRYGFKQKHSR